MEIYKNHSLKDLNTFGMDVSANHFAIVTSGEELKELFSMAEVQNLPKLVLGGGSNILFTKDFGGLVIQNKTGGIKLTFEDENYVLIEAGGGVVWDNLVEFCVERNFGGLENLSLIPGTVGASPIQNIGAYGVEIKDVFEKLQGFNSETCEFEEYKLNDCRFGYRDSIFKHELKNRFIITSVTYRLKKNPVINLKYDALRKELAGYDQDRLTIKDVSQAVISVRKSKLPSPEEFGNAGSFFKNPETDENHFRSLQALYPEIPGYNTSGGMVKIPAGWLIEKSGWKGRRIGQAGMFEKQALVLVNYGGATPGQILQVARLVTAEVKEKFNIHLEMEVNII